MRFGIYGIHQGREYHVDRNPAEGPHFILYSRDPADLARGFKLDGNALFSKNVTPNDLEATYQVRTYARYRGHTFLAVQERPGEMLLSAGDADGPEELGFTWLDRNEWEKWVKVADLEEVWEERTSFRLG